MQISVQYIVWLQHKFLYGLGIKVFDRFLQWYARASEGNVLNSLVLTTRLHAEAIFISSLTQLKFEDLELIVDYIFMHFWQAYASEICSEEHQALGLSMVCHQYYFTCFNGSIVNQES